MALLLLFSSLFYVGTLDPVYLHICHVFLVRFLLPFAVMLSPDILITIGDFTDSGTAPGIYRTQYCVIIRQSSIPVAVPASVKSAIIIFDLVILYRSLSFYLTVLSVQMQVGNRFIVYLSAWIDVEYWNHVFSLLVLVFYLLTLWCYFY